MLTKWVWLSLTGHVGDNFYVIDQGEVDVSSRLVHLLEFHLRFIPLVDHSISATLIYYPPFASIAKGEVFVLLLLFCSFFCQRFLDNPQANSRQILHAGQFWFPMCLLPFWGLAAPCGRKKGEMKFLLLLESMGNFCILAVFERYLSNACTDPHQILFV